MKQLEFDFSTEENGKTTTKPDVGQEPRAITADPVVTKKKIRKANQLMAYTADDFEGMFFVETGESGAYTILHGTLFEKKESGKESSIVLRNGKEVKRFNIPLTHPDYPKVVDAWEHAGTSMQVPITVLLLHDKCIGVKLGPRFGRLGWRFANSKSGKIVTDFLVER